MAFTMLLTVYDFLTDTGLYILIHVRIGKPQHQTIRPVLIPVNSAGFEIFYRCLEVIIIIRIILESIDFISKTILEGLSEVDV